MNRLSKTLRILLSSTATLALATGVAAAAPSEPVDDDWDQPSEEPMEPTLDGEADSDVDVDVDDDPVEYDHETLEEGDDSLNRDTRVNPQPPAPQPAATPTPDRNIYYTENNTVIAPQEDNDGPDHLTTNNGMAFSVGGGVMNFVDDSTQAFTDAGGAWQARLTYGTRSPIAVEASYIGSAQNITALGLDSNAALLGTGGEAALRLNIPGSSVIQPYALAGVGLTNYRIVNESFNNSSVADSDNVYHIPLAAGIGFRASGLLIDLRGTYRNTFDAELSATANDVDASASDANFDNWMATAAAGIEF